jgi:hypothetical protein
VGWLDGDGKGPARDFQSGSAAANASVCVMRWVRIKVKGTEQRAAQLEARGGRGSTATAAAR